MRKIVNNNIFREIFLQEVGKQEMMEWPVHHVYTSTSMLKINRSWPGIPVIIFLLFLSSQCTNLYLSFIGSLIPHLSLEISFNNNMIYTDIRHRYTVSTAVPSEFSHSRTLRSGQVYMPLIVPRTTSQSGDGPLPPSVLYVEYSPWRNQELTS